MEAARFGFGSSASVSPAFKFDPTDDDIVAHYLLPRALGVPRPRFAHAVIEADPASLPPPDLLALHGHATSHHAFFLDVSKNGGRRDREIKGGAGGKWHGQQGHNRSVTLLGPGGDELDIEYRRYDLTYKRYGEEDKEEEEDTKGKKRKRKNGGTPAGWVMHEYTIVSPPLHNTVLSRINRKAGKIKEDQVYPATEQPGPSYFQGYFPYQEQPGPSHHHDIPCQEQAGPSHHHDFPFQQQAGPSHHHDIQYQEQPGPSHHYDDIPYQEQAGPSHHHDFPCQQQPGPSHHQDIPYREQPRPSHHQDYPYHQQVGPGPSYYHHPMGMLCDGGGSDGRQADDGSWHCDNVGGMGDGFVNMLTAGDCFDADNTYNDHPLDGFSDGSKADDASFYGDNAGGMGNGYVNMIYAGEGFAGDYHRPYDMMCSAGQGFSDGSQAGDASNNGSGMGAGTTPTTAATCTTMTSTCQVAATPRLSRQTKSRNLN